jgi:superfamily II DNA or RNA helicase
MAYHCPFLFIDEAHHVAAATWQRLKKKFEKQYILQFTATPFRNDGQLVGGKIIFNYPMRKALDEGYFKPVKFDPVLVFDKRKGDQAIAEKAIAQLRADSEKYDHILMARVDSIDRAHEVYTLYEL